MENIFGGLIEFSSEEEFEYFITQIEDSDAVSIIEKAIEFAHRNNTYSLRETYFIYKCLKKLKEKKP